MKLFINGIAIDQVAKPADPPAYAVKLGKPVRVPGRTSFPNERAAIDAFERMLAEAAERSLAIDDVNRRMSVLLRKIGDPRLWDHPKRPEAEIRYRELKAERATLNFLLESHLSVMADTWFAFPGGLRAYMHARGWANPPSKEAFIAWMQASLDLGITPGEEPPF